MSDELAGKKLKPKMNIIINLESARIKGSHWVCFLVRGKYGFYCDSFGAPPDTNVIDFCKKNRLHLAVNTFIFQDMDSTACGLFAFSLIKYMDTEKIPHDCPTEYSNVFYDLANNYVNLYHYDTTKNDCILGRYLKKNK